MLDLSEVGFVKRIVVGRRDPQSLLGEDAIEAAMVLLNRCLTEYPRGRILGTEKTFSILGVGEHQVVLQSVIYHVGFARRPAWLAD